MDFRRVRFAEFLALTVGGGLLVDLFLPWYSFRSGRLDAWDSLAVTPVPLAVAGLAAVYLFVVTLTQRAPALPVAAAVWVTLLGLVASLFAIVRVAALPGGAFDRCYGNWAGLGLSVGVFAAGWLSMRDERPLRAVPATTPGAGP